MKINKNTVIVDIDGTISRVGERLVYLQTEPKDWDAFYEACFEDEPIKEMCELVQCLDAIAYNVIFCTGRRESIREKTVEWIHKYVFKDNVSVDYVNDRLVMRPDNDFRHDTEVKFEMLKKAGVKLHQIGFVLEDRNSMVDKWRSLGVRCLQVAPGDF